MNVLANFPSRVLTPSKDLIAPSPFNSDFKASLVTLFTKGLEIPLPIQSNAAPSVKDTRPETPNANLAACCGLIPLSIASS